MAEDRLEQLLSYLQEDPTDPFLYYALATENLRRGATAPALNYFKTLVERFPAYVGTYYHYAKLLEKLGRTEEAVDLYRAGIKVADDARDLHSRKELAQALEDLLGE